MKLDVINNAKSNIVSGVLNRVLMLLLPFFNRTLFLWLMSPEYLGLNGVFGSLLGMLSLAELGFGTAVVCSLYRRIAEDDRAGIRACLNYYRGIYRRIGLLILLSGLLILPFLKNLVHGRIPEGISLHALYLIHLANTVSSYFLYAYKGALLDAYQRQDIQADIRTLVSLLQYGTTLMILLLTGNYYFYVISTVGFTILHNLLIAVRVRRLFPDLTPSGTLEEEQRKKIQSDVRHIFLNRIGSVISYSADNLVISSFLGLTAVAAFGNYYYAYTAAGGFIYVFCTALTAGFGNAVHTESVRKNFHSFMQANRTVLILVTWSCAVMLAVIQPFIRCWTQNNPLMIRHLPTAVLIVLYFYVYYSRQMLLTFKSAAGIWKPDRFKAVISGLVNLGLNICMIHFWELDGVLLSTIIAFLLIEIPWESRVTFRCYFDSDKRSGTGSREKKYWQVQLFSAFAAVIICTGTWYAAELSPEGGIPALLLKGITASAAAAFGTAAFHRRVIFHLIRKYFLRNRFSSATRGKKRKKIILPFDFSARRP